VLIQQQLQLAFAEMPLMADPDQVQLPVIVQLMLHQTNVFVRLILRTTVLIQQLLQLASAEMPLMVDLDQILKLVTAPSTPLQLIVCVLLMILQTYVFVLKLSKVELLKLIQKHAFAEMPLMADPDQVQLPVIVQLMLHQTNVSVRLILRTTVPIQQLLQLAFAEMPLMVDLDQILKLVTAPSTPLQLIVCVLLMILQTYVFVLKLSKVELLKLIQKHVNAEMPLMVDLDRTQLIVCVLRIQLLIIASVQLKLKEVQLKQL
jgi:hypothetical protein